MIVKSKIHIETNKKKSFIHFFLYSMIAKKVTIYEFSKLLILFESIAEIHQISKETADKKQEG